MRESSDGYERDKNKLYNLRISEEEHAMIKELSKKYNIAALVRGFIRKTYETEMSSREYKD